MEILETTKAAYRADSSYKELRVYFPDIDLTLTNGQIDMESMEIVESLSEDDSIEFVGCISSQLKLTVHDVSENIKGETISVYIKADDTEEICLFNGKVEEVSISANKSHKSITAYDVLYEKGETDVALWYNNLEFPISLKNIRDSLFSRLEITQEIVDLPNDDITVEKQYSPNTLKALDVIKSICQINGVFGIINRNNRFEYRVLPKSESATVTEAIQYQKGLEYQEYIVNPVDRLTIRQSSDDEGVSYGSGDNTYIIQGNMFTLNLEAEDLETIATNIYPNVDGFYYRPFESDNNGFPWIECGEDIVSYSVYDYDNSTPGNPVYKTMTFFILKRTLKGIQNLRDSYSAEGDEFQRVFITDIQSQVETIVESIQQISGRLEDFSMNYVYFLNSEKIVINDGETQLIGWTNFLVSKPTQVMAKMEYLLSVETTEDDRDFYDCEVTVNYYYDGNLIYTRQPKETYTDGKHILGLFYLINVEDVLVHNWEVTITANGGTVTIEIGDALNVIHGQKLMETGWDGLLKIKQKIGRIDLGTPEGIITRNVESNLNIATQIPTSDSISQEIGRIILGTANGITTRGINESLDFETTDV